MAIVGLLRDMALAQPDRHREWAYKRAAASVMGLPRALPELLGEGLDLLEIPHIGPASARVVREFLDAGASAAVEAAIDRSGRRAKVDAARALRDGFLSHAAVREALASRRAAVSGKDYRGDFQMHSEWSDGAASLDQIAEWCLHLGHECACITDHSAGLAVAQGIGAEQVRAQHAEIDRLNEAYEGRFRFLKGIEANLDADGGVDVPPDERAAFDLVIAAPHSGLRLALDQTPRLLNAVGERGVHVLGHPRGRKYGSRAGILADWDAVFARAAETGVAIEIDGSPERQDIDYRLARRALAAGCLFALDSDAHDERELPFYEYALAHARLAGIPADRVINCWPYGRLQEWADSRRS
jgi:putative hydrolase